jgi:hypothetical protein
MSVTTKQLNPGPLSAARGAEAIAFGFRVNGTSTPSSLWQCEANAITSVTWDDTNKYFVVQFNKAYPREIVAALAQGNDAYTVTTGYQCKVDIDSYSTTTGQVLLWVNGDTNGDGTWGKVTPADDTPITCFLWVQRVNALVTAHT